MVGYTIFLLLKFARVALCVSAIGFAALRCAADPTPKGTGPLPRVVFIIGENEYHTWETLPDLAAHEFKAAGVEYEFVMASSREHDNVFTNFALIKNADLLFLSARRRTPPKEMMALIRAHLRAGKPLVGIRTASHAFGADPPDAQHEGWRTFDRDILGCSYQGKCQSSLFTQLIHPSV